MSIPADLKDLLIAVISSILGWLARHFTPRDPPPSGPVGTP